jgi:hypothetical protein
MATLVLYLRLDKPLIMNKNLNPLNVFEQRKLNFIPAHFSKIILPHTIINQKINDWIYNNLNSRYCIKKQYGLNSERKFVTYIEIGIEDPREMTLFSLACPYLKT